MESSRFDPFARMLGRLRTRRTTLRALGASLVAGLIAPSRSAATPCGPPICNGCSGVGVPCGQDSQCCSNLCLNTGKCGCRANGGACQNNANCCAGSRCKRGVCVPVTDYAFWRSWDVDEGFLRGIAVDASGRVYATASPAVLKFTAQGGLIDSWGGEGSGDGQFDVPCGIAVDRATPAPGRVYVVDTYNERIQAFTESGDFDFAWGGGFGGGDGEFEEACCIAVDTMRNIYVVDWGLGNHRVQKFTRRGGFITSWGGFGNGNGEFEFPRGIAIHGSKVYVADASNDRIQQFSLSGSFQLKWGGTGGGNGKFHNPFDVAVDQAGSVYVADRLNHRVQKFLDRSYVTQFGGIGSGAGELNEPHALAVDGKGRVYVADSGHARIVAFTPA